MSRITLAREYPDDRDVIAQICKLKSRTSATEKETSQIEQHLNETDQRVTDLEEVTKGLDPGDIETVKTIADTVQLHTTQINTLDNETAELIQDVDAVKQNYVTTNTEQIIPARKEYLNLYTQGTLHFDNPAKQVEGYIGYDHNSKGMYVTNNEGDLGLFAVGHDVHVQNPSANAGSDVATNIGYVSETGYNARNNLLHKDGNEIKTGQLRFNGAIHIAGAFTDPNGTALFMDCGDPTSHIGYRLRLLSQANGNGVLLMDKFTCNDDGTFTGYLESKTVWSWSEH